MQTRPAAAWAVARAFPEGTRLRSNCCHQVWWHRGSTRSPGRASRNHPGSLPVSTAWCVRRLLRCRRSPLHRQPRCRGRSVPRRPPRWTAQCRQGVATRCGWVPPLPTPMHRTSEPHPDRQRPHSTPAPRAPGVAPSRSASTMWAAAPGEGHRREPSGASDVRRVPSGPRGPPRRPPCRRTMPTAAGTLLRRSRRSHARRVDPRRRATTSRGGAGRSGAPPSGERRRRRR